MAPLRVSTTKSEWLPDDPTAVVPTRLWKLPFITTWDDSRNQNRPTDSAEVAFFVDDNFMAPASAGNDRAVRYAHALRRNHVEMAFALQTRSSDVSPAVFEALHEAGLRVVFLGLESG